MSILGGQHSCYVNLVSRLFTPIKIEYGVAFDFHDVYPITAFFILRGLAGKQHNAVDITVPVGTSVHAPERMQVHEVVHKGFKSKIGYGKFIRAISLEDHETEFFFAHLNVVPYPRVGKIWQANQVFAWTGKSGWATGSHLHFAMRLKGVWIDPSTRKWI